MNNKEFAARLIVLEHKAQELVGEIRQLFQDALDNPEPDDVE